MASIHAWCGRTVAVVLLAVTLPTLFGKEPTEDAAVLPTRAPYDELTPKCDELGKWGYVAVSSRKGARASGEKGATWVQE